MKYSPGSVSASCFNLIFAVAISVWASSHASLPSGAVQKRSSKGVTLGLRMDHRNINPANLSVRWRTMLSTLLRHTGRRLTPYAKQPKHAAVQIASVVPVRRPLFVPTLRAPKSTYSVSAFYKGESQEKKLPGDWKEQRFLPGSPAHVMLGGSWGFFFRRVMLLS
jgi:hypothetical protein